VRDYGLLLSMLVAFAVPSLLARLWPLRTFDLPAGFLDAALMPTAAGLAVGRLTAIALDDPRSIGRVADILVVRSGVEFWPGVIAAVVTASWSARRAGTAPLARLADIAPLGMLGYAGYEVTCLVRDGCYGPHSGFGLVPDGLLSRMLPVGVLIAAVIAASAVIVRQAQLRGSSPVLVVLTGIAVISTTRAVGSFWLPKVGDGLTRQHLSSIIVSAASIVLGVVAIVGSRRTRQVAT